MSIEVWLSLALAHLLGAMSPGPSLALVLRNTMRGGRKHGVVTSIGHGLGFGVYSCLVATSLVTALALHPSIDTVLRWVGTLVLLYLGFMFVRHGLRGPGDPENDAPAPESSGSGFMQGFAVSIFSPKILAWMLAIYAPFLHEGLSALTIASMVLMGIVIDGGWYVLAATVLSSGNWLGKIRSHAHQIDLAMGILMLVFAAILIFRG